MKNNTSNFHLVARMQGQKLTIHSELRDELASIYDHRISQLNRQSGNRDSYLHQMALELERKGDFLFACASYGAAMKAYIEASRIRLQSPQNDRKASREARAACTERTRTLSEKIEQCAACDNRLNALWQRDRS